MTDTMETFQQRVEREREETRRRYQNLYHGVLAHMGDGWSVQADKSEHYNEWSFKLVSGAYRLSLGLSKGKVNVSGYWPQRGGVYGSYTSPSDVRESSPDISVTESRGYEAIAKEIKRRFLPEYQRIFALILAKIEQDNDYTARKLAAWKRITTECAASLSHIRTSERDSEDHRASIQTFGHGYGDIRMSSDNSVQLDIRSIPVDMAIRIIQAISAGKDKS